MRLIALLYCAIAAALANEASAQTLYKVTAPDGSVTYTDRAPPPGTANAIALQAPGAGIVAEPLPAALRGAVARFPVVLYTTAGCEPCDAGRELLRRRGVPHEERRATRDEERDAWPRIVGGTQAPALAIGRQMLHGFAPEQWHRDLDLAGYPREARLPPHHALRPPQPLLPPAARTAAGPQAPADAAPGAPAPGTAAPSAPAMAAPPAPHPPATGGFRF